MNYKRIAKWYDFLARLVYGQSHLKAQGFFFSQFKAGDHIMVVGGGTGSFLALLPDMHTRISFVEPSPQMLSKAKRRAERLTTSIRIDFHEQTIEDYGSHAPVQWLLVPFFLDQFSEKQIGKHLLQMKRFVGLDTQLILTEFRDTTFWKHKMLLWIMYRFFRLTTQIEAIELPDYEKELIRGGFNKIDQRLYYNGFIGASKWTFS